MKWSVHSFVIPPRSPRECSLWVVTKPLFVFFSVVPRRTSGSSECRSKERETCCNYWEITLCPSTSSAVPSLPRTHSKHITFNSSLMHINTKLIPTGSRLRHLLRPRQIRQIQSRPENWRQPTGALQSIQTNLSHEQLHEAPHPRDP